MGNFNIKRNKDMNLFQASINMKTASEPIRHGKGGISISHQRRRGGVAARGRNASHSFHMSWWKSAEPNALVRAVKSMILLPPAPQNSPSSAYRVSASPALHVRLESRRSHCCPPPRCGRIRSMAATRRSQLLWS